VPELCPKEEAEAFNILSMAATNHPVRVGCGLIRTHGFIQVLNRIGFISIQLHPPSWYTVPRIKFGEKCPNSSQTQTSSSMQKVVNRLLEPYTLHNINLSSQASF
jgi:hypothetical protein